MAKPVTYECRKCGTEVVVTKAAGAHLQPIYCCGDKVGKPSSAKKSASKTRPAALPEIKSSGSASAATGGSKKAGASKSPSVIKPAGRKTAPAKKS